VIEKQLLDKPLLHYETQQQEIINGKEITIIVTNEAIRTFNNFDRLRNTRKDNQNGCPLVFSVV